MPGDGGPPLAGLRLTQVFGSCASGAGSAARLLRARDSRATAVTAGRVRRDMGTPHGGCGLRVRLENAIVVPEPKAASSFAGATSPPVPKIPTRLRTLSRFTP